MKVTGKPKPTSKWYKEGVQILSSDEFEIEEFEDGSSILTINETYPDDTGEIVYEAHNPLGVCTTTTYLSVGGNIVNLGLTKNEKKFAYFLSLIYVNIIFKVLSDPAFKTSNSVPNFLNPIT